MNGLSKAALARHLTQLHGEARSLVPLTELRRWTREKLDAAHQELMGHGPCPSFDELRLQKTDQPEPPPTERSPAEAHQQAMALLGEALSVVDGLIRANPDDTEGLARTYLMLDRMSTDVRSLKDDAKRLCVASFDDKSLTIDDFAVIEKTWKPKRTFDKDKVVTLLVMAAERAIDKADEHGDNPARAAVVSILSMLYATEPKKNALKAHGVDIDDISSVEWGDPGLKITPVLSALGGRTAITEGVGA